MTRKERREERQARQTAARETQIKFGPVRVGHDCLEETEGVTASGQPVTHTFTSNREAIVPASEMH